MLDLLSEFTGLNDKILDFFCSEDIYFKDAIDSFNGFNTKYFNDDSFLQNINNFNGTDLIKSIFLSLKNEFHSNYTNNNNVMSTILCMIVISFLSSSIKSSKFQPEIKYCNIIISLLTIGIFYDLYNKVFSIINDIFILLKSILPVYLGVSFISNSNPFLRALIVFFISGFHFLCLEILLPLIMICYISTVINSVSQNCFPGIKDTIVSSVNWVIGIYTALHLTMIKLTDISGFNINGVMYNGLRYTFSKGIPVVGNYVSDTLGVIINGFININGFIGFTASAVIIAASVLPFLYSLLIGILFRFTGSFSGLFGDKTTSDLLTGLGMCIIELAIILILCIIGIVCCFCFFV